MGAEPSKPSNGTGIRPGTVNGSNDSSGINRIDRHVQQRFVRGVHYNLKIIIRGKRNVGKSTLFRRLKGQVYQPEVCIKSHYNLFSSVLSRFIGLCRSYIKVLIVP